MFKVTRTLTNVKPAKSTKPEIETAPTPGHFRINPLAYAKMGVTIGDYIAVVEAKEEIEGEVVLSQYVTVGHGGDGDGNFGSKVSSTNGKDSGSFGFSSQNAWNSLNGNTDEKQVYVLADGIEDEEGNVFFRLVFDRTEPKIERTSSED